jgi:micrococcal nuclease
MICFLRDIQGFAITAVVCTVAVAFSEKAPQPLSAQFVQKQSDAVPTLTVRSVTPSPRIPIEVLRVIDGDTVEVRAQIWLDQHITTKVRLRSIDAPELNAKCPAEAKMAEASRHRLTTLIGAGQAYLTDLGRDKYGGRVVGTILTHQGDNIAASLLAGGHVRPYNGGKRGSWC